MAARHPARYVNFSSYLGSTAARVVCIKPAVHHTSTVDDEYDGYFIPRGAIIMGNAWYA